MPESLKAYWEVRGGLIPGQVMPELVKRYHYTSLDFENDGGMRGNMHACLRAEAHGYATDLEQGGINWASVDYFWL